MVIIIRSPLTKYLKKTKIITLQVPDKMIARLKLAKKRVENAHIEDNCAELIDEKRFPAP